MRGITISMVVGVVLGCMLGWTLRGYYVQTVVYDTYYYYAQQGNPFPVYITMRNGIEHERGYYVGSDYRKNKNAGPNLEAPKR